MTRGKEIGKLVKSTLKSMEQTESLIDELLTLECGGEPEFFGSKANRIIFNALSEMLAGLGYKLREIS